MAYQITLNDEDYATLKAAATQHNQPIEMLLHDAIAARYTSTVSSWPRATYIYPTNQPDSPEELAEDERLAALVGSEHPWASEIIIEDRGPR